MSIDTKDIFDPTFLLQITQRNYDEARHTFHEQREAWLRSWLNFTLRANEISLEQNIHQILLDKLGCSTMSTRDQDFLQQVIYELLSTGMYVGRYCDFPSLKKKGAHSFFVKLYPFIKMQSTTKHGGDFFLERYEMKFLEPLPSGISSKEVARWMDLIEFFVGEVTFKPRCFLPYSLFNETHFIPFPSLFPALEEIESEKQRGNTPGSEGGFIGNPWFLDSGLDTPLNSSQISAWTTFIQSCGARSLRKMLNAGHLRGENGPQEVQEKEDPFQYRAATELLHRREPLGVVVTTNLERWEKLRELKDFPLIDKLSLFKFRFFYDARDHLHVIKNSLELRETVLGAYQFSEGKSHDPLI